jgi:hypothetical protein
MNIAELEVKHAAELAVLRHRTDNPHRPCWLFEQHMARQKLGPIDTVTYLVCNPSRDRALSAEVALGGNLLDSYEHVVLGLPQHFTVDTVRRALRNLDRAYYLLDKRKGEAA